MIWFLAIKVVEKSWAYWTYRLHQRSIGGEFLVDGWSRMWAPACSFQEMPYKSSDICAGYRWHLWYLWFLGGVRVLHQCHWKVCINTNWTSITIMFALTNIDLLPLNLRWDYQQVQQLPDCMKICFKALQKTIDDIANDILQENGSAEISTYLRKAVSFLPNVFIC